MLPDGVSVAWFGRTPMFGTLARPDAEPMVALNTMLAEDGAMIGVPAGVDAGTLLLVSLGGDLHGTPSAFHPRHAVTLAPGARLTLVEVAHGRGHYLHNPVMEVHVAKGATLTHVRCRTRRRRVPPVHGLCRHRRRRRVRQLLPDAGRPAGAHGDACAAARGERHGAPERGAAAGRHAACGLHHRGAAPGAVLRLAPDGEERAVGPSRGVFQGRIEVDRIAQKTDGYQMNQALLLSPDAEIDASRSCRSTPTT